MTLLGTLLAVAPAVGALVLAERDVRRERRRRQDAEGFAARAAARLAVAEARVAAAEDALTRSLVERTAFANEVRANAERNIATFAALRAQLADLRAVQATQAGADVTLHPPGGLLS